MLQPPAQSNVYNVALVHFSGFEKVGHPWSRTHAFPQCPLLHILQVWPIMV